jgi:hypothetical protein
MDGKEVLPENGKEMTMDRGSVSPDAATYDLEALDKSRWQRLWPVIACGAGLFSDGYLNGVSNLPTVETHRC